MSEDTFNTAQTLLAAIEDEFTCTGVCRGDYIYYFSKSYKENNFPDNPTDGCYKQIRDFIDVRVKYLKAGGIVVSAFLLIKLVLTCSIICKDK